MPSLGAVQKSTNACLSTINQLHIVKFVLVDVDAVDKDFGH